MSKKEKIIKERIENYVRKLFTGQKLSIEEIGGYSDVSVKNRRR